MSKRVKAVIGLFLGFILGVPSAENIFQIIFIEQFSNGNPSALIGWATGFFVGLIGTLNSIAIVAGYENLKEACDVLR